MIGGGFAFIKTGKFLLSRFFSEIRCFIAGPPVQTDQGLKPIEMIQVGDRVASRDEVTGETTWKPVVRLFRNTNQPILRVTLDNERGQQETLGTTPEHPLLCNRQGLD